jgi:hypothetical protein
MDPDVNVPSTPVLKESGYPKQNVLLLILLSLITVGIYIPFWYKRYMKLSDFATIKSGMVNAFLALQIVYVINTIIELTYFSVILLVILLFLDLIIIITLFILQIILAFEMRRILINKGHDINPILTFFFTVFYLQYKINKI